MIPSIAVITSPDTPYSFMKKVCGLYILERNIKLLINKGFNRILLNLNEEEENFYLKRIKKHIKSHNCEIIITNKKEKNALAIDSNIFLQAHYIDSFKGHFNKKGSFYKPVMSEYIFAIRGKNQRKTAEKLISDYIISNTGGFLAQKVNKRISIPISKIVAPLRIHPNYLTFFNICIGIASSACLLLAAKIFINQGAHASIIYPLMASGGILFQLASVLDGVDGEVAKFTFTVSKIGGWLDTFGDNMTLIMFLVSASIVNFVFVGGIISALSIGLLFLGLIVMFSIMISYLKNYSSSGSLVAYDTDFLQKLPQDDIFVSFALKTKYFTKKEFFSLAFCILALLGKIQFLIPLVSLAVVISACILTIIQIKYIRLVKEGKL